MTLSVAQIDPETDRLIDEWLPLSEVAARLGITIGKAKQLLRDKKLIGVRRGDGMEPQVPAAFLGEKDVLKGLPGTLTLLSDAGYDDLAALRWLFTADDSLPGTPIQAIAAGRHTEVKRRAQALAF